MFDSGDISIIPKESLTKQQITGKLALVRDSIKEHQSSLAWLLKEEQELIKALKGN